nr:helix-turn-helix domain-containing protein [Frankia sp. Cas3]
MARMIPTATPVDPADSVDPTDPTDNLVADVFARACPSRRTLENITGKWGVLALIALTEDTYRFNALRRRVDGISEKMLAQTLHALERDGLVRREVQTSIPPHVEYSLTPLGSRVATKLRDLIDLVEAEMPTVIAAQEDYDRR